MKVFIKNADNGALVLAPHPETYLTDLIALDQSTMHYPWPEKTWHNELGNTHTYAALYPDVGFILFDNNPLENTLHLLKIALLENQRGQGRAQLIFQEFLELISQERGNGPAVFLEVESKNDRAIAFYHKLGFKKLHLKKKFYSDGLDALSMIYQSESN